MPDLMPYGTYTFALRVFDRDKVREMAYFTINYSEYGSVQTGQSSTAQSSASTAQSQSAGNTSLPAVDLSKTPPTQNSNIPTKTPKKPQVDPFTATLRITDKEGNPISDATVSIAELNIRAITNGDGLVTFTVPEQKNYRITIRKKDASEHVFEKVLSSNDQNNPISLQVNDTSYAPFVWIVVITLFILFLFFLFTWIKKRR